MFECDMNSLAFSILFIGNGHSTKINQNKLNNHRQYGEYIFYNERERKKKRKENLLHVVVFEWNDNDDEVVVR